MNNETKLGLFVMAGVFLFSVIIALLGDFQLQRRYYINILFNDIAGLPERAKVKIAGVEVGAVKTITLEGNKAKIKVALVPEVKIRKDAVASIMSTGLIGSKYLELTKGVEGEYLKNGDTITGVDPLSFDKIMSDVMDQFNSLTEAFKGVKGHNLGSNIAVTLENLRKVSDSLRVALAENEQEMSDMVKNFNRASKNIADITEENKDDLRSAIVNMKNVSEKLDKILEEAGKGEGVLAKLMSDKEMGSDLKSTFSDLKETSQEAKRALKRLSSIDVKWDYTFRYDVRDEIGRHDAGLRIAPRPDKFYVISVSNAGGETPGLVDPEKLNTFNLLIGRQYQAAQVYAGVIRPNGGFGAKLKPFWKWDPWRRIEITAEGYDFSRQIPVKKPKINMGLCYELSKNITLGSQLEDPYSKSNVNTYMNLKFKDDDIGYILGLIGLAKP